MIDTNNLTIRKNNGPSLLQLEREGQNNIKDQKSSVWPRYTNGKYVKEWNQLVQNYISNARKYTLLCD